MQYRYLLFDADDTLFDFLKAEHQAITETLETFGLPADEETIALYPDKSYDITGCWSGAVINDPDVTKGETWLVYTGVDNGRASMRFARPTDKEFLHFEKLSTHAITGVPGGYSADFRDPYYFRCNNKAYLMVGSSKNGLGCTILFEWNGSGWTHKGECFVGSSKAECGELRQMSVFSIALTMSSKDISSSL